MREMPALPIESAGILLVGIVPNPYMTEKGRDERICRMPATKEQLHEAMRNVGITADNPQDFSIRGYSDDPEKHIALPYEMVCAADVDELNFLAARLEQLDPAEVGKLNAALQQKNGLV